MQGARDPGAGDEAAGRSSGHSRGRGSHRACRPRWGLGSGPGTAHTSDPVPERWPSTGSSPRGTRLTCRGCRTRLLRPSPRRARSVGVRWGRGRGRAGRCPCCWTGDRPLRTTRLQVNLHSLPCTQSPRTQAQTVSGPRLAFTSPFGSRVSSLPSRAMPLLQGALPSLPVSRPPPPLPRPPGDLHFCQRSQKASSHFSGQEPQTLLQKNVRLPPPCSSTLARPGVHLLPDYKVRKH